MSRARRTSTDWSVSTWLSHSQLHQTMRALPCLFHESAGPGDWRSCDASIAIAAPRSRRGLRTIHAPYSPFLRFSFPARLSPESRPQAARAVVYIDQLLDDLFCDLDSSAATSWTNASEISTNWTERCRCFLHEFLDDAFAELTWFFQGNSDCSDFNPPGSTRERSLRSFWHSVTIPHRSGVLISAPGLLCVAQEATGVLWRQNLHAKFSSRLGSWGAASFGVGVISSSTSQIDNWRIVLGSWKVCSVLRLFEFVWLTFEAKRTF